MPTKGGRTRTHPKETERRFWSQIEITDDCWLWRGTRQKFGHGILRVAGRTCLTHRHMWTLRYGRIPDGLCVLHHCDNPPCVNPEHLFIGTKKDNTQDMIAKGRAKLSTNTDKTHCKYGHEFTPENTYQRLKGGRECRECRKRFIVKRRVDGWAKGVKPCPARMRVWPHIRALGDR